MGTRSLKTFIVFIAALAISVLVSAGQPIAAAAPTGLVAAYSFDEGSGASVADTSGNANNGAIANATWTTSGKYGAALSFNGSSSRVNVADSASLHLSSAMTLEAWVKPSSVSSDWRDVVYKGDDNYYLMGSTDSAGVPAGGGIIGGSHGEVFGAGALSAGTWSYLAVSYDGATERLYVNGTQVASTPKTGSIAGSSNPLTIGGDAIYGQYFNGLIDNVRVYSVALTAAQIQTDMTTPVASVDTTPPSAPGTLTATAKSGTEIDLAWAAATDNVAVSGYRVERCQGQACTSFAQIATATATSYQDTGVVAGTSYSYRVRAVDTNNNLGPYGNTAAASTPSSVRPGLVAAYSFDEGTGSSLGDRSGYGNTGTITGATWVAGKYGQALQFDGKSSRVNVPDAPSLRLGSAMTLEAWVKPSTSANAWRDLVYKGDDDYFLMASTDNGGVPASAALTSTKPHVYGPAALPTGSWSHLAVTYDGTTLRLYVNGSLVASSAASGAITPTSNPLQIGSDSIYGQYFNGLIDEVRVYNTALSAAAIVTDMNTPVGGAPAPPADTTPPSKPAGLATSAVTQTSMSLSWSASSDNVGVSGYRLFQNGSQVGTTASTSSSFTGLSCGTSYTLGVAAYDAAGNVSSTASVTAPTSACTDASPPSTPTGLAASAITQTSATLSWSASTDNVGVSGYRLYSNGVQVGTTASTSYGFSGLTCGTTYTLGVVAYDAAGNLSSTASVGAQTSACGGGGGSGANVFVSPSGSDSSCARGDSSHPCATFAKACAIAQSGDLISVANGSYATQDLSGCVKTSPGVTFQAVTPHGAHATGAQIGSSSGKAAWITLDGIDLGSFAVEGAHGGTGTTTSHITIENMKVTDHSEPGSSNLVYIADVDHFTWSHSELGPACCNNDGIDLFGSQPGNDFVTFDHLNVHDLVGGDSAFGDNLAGCDHIPSALWSNCRSSANPFSGNHVDCLQILSAGNLTITGSRFVNCWSAGNLQNGVINGSHDWNWTITNSVFEGGGNIGEYETEFRTGGSSGQAFLATDPDTGTRAYIRLYNNTFVGGIMMDSSTAPSGTELTAVGNIIGPIMSSCNPAGFAWTRFDYNLVTTNTIKSCYPTSIVGTPNYTNTNPTTTNPVDLHLNAGSPGIDTIPANTSGLPTVDLDGTARPQGNAADTGAYER